MNRSAMGELRGVMVLTVKEELHNPSFVPAQVREASSRDSPGILHLQRQAKRATTDASQIPSVSLCLQRKRVFVSDGRQ